MPSQPSKEYIRLGSRIIAIENDAGSQGVAVTVSPPAVALSNSQTQQFTAAVAGSTNLAVTWSISPSTGSGSIDPSSGVFTAPSTITTPSTVTVVATSQADPTKTGNATVTLLPPSSGGLPNGWSDCTVGSDPGAATTYANGVFTLTSASQTGLGGTSDTFKFACQQLVGDGTIITRLAGTPTISGSNQFGIMLRAGTTPGSAYAMVGMFVTSNVTYLNFYARTDTGQNTTTLPSPTPSAAAPYWFKLVRGGSTITGYSSPNGVDWTQLGAMTLAGSYTTLYAGLVVSANTCCSTIPATFDNVIVSNVPDFYITVLPPTWTSSAAGDTSSYTIGLNGINGFSDIVSLTATGLPPGATSSFNPPTVTGAGTTTLTVSTAPSTAAASYSFTVNAASAGGITHINYATLNVSNSATQALPLEWANTVMGTTNHPDGATYANGVFTLTSTALAGIGATSDSFEFAYQPLVGDGTIVARLAGISMIWGANQFGIMLRTGPTPTAAYALAGIFATSGVTNLNFYARTDTGQNTTTLPSPTPTVGTPYWMKLVWTGSGSPGSTITGYSSPNGMDWTPLGRMTLAGSYTTLYAGLALSANNCCHTISTTFDNVLVTNSIGSSTPDFSFAFPGGTQSVNAGGSVNFTGTVTALGGFNGPVAFGVAMLPSGATATFSPPTVTSSGVTTLTVNTSPSVTGNFLLNVVASSGTLVHSATASLTINPVQSQPPGLVSATPTSGTGASQTFSFTVAPGTGDVSWVEVLINGSLSGVSACYLHYDWPSNTIYLRDDTNPSWVGSGTLGATATLSNSQCVLDLGNSSAAQPNGPGTNLTLNLALSFTPTFAGNQNVYLLIDNATLNSGWATAATWTVPVPVGALPTGWGNTVMGTTNPPNGATYANGVFTLTSTALAGIGGTSDSLEFAYQPLVGDGTLVVRLAGIPTIWGSNQFGIMFRTGPTPTAAFAMVGLFVNGGPTYLNFYSRTDTGQSATTPPAGPAVTAPYWLKLVRTGSANPGSTITGYTSSDGVTWTQIGTMTLTGLYTTLYAGPAVSANNCCHTISATFDNLILSSTQDFYLLGSGSATAFAGSSASFTINVSPLNAFNGTVALSTYPLPSGTTATFSPSALTGGGSTSLALTTSPSTPIGSYPITVVATSGSITHTVGVTLNVMGPARPSGSTIDSTNPLSTNLAGLFLMNESTGTTDLNLVDTQYANFAGGSLPTWNTSDPSIVFNGGSSLHSYLDAGTDLTFDQLPTGKMTVVAKVYINTLASAGVAEKNDDNCCDSGFIFGWDSGGVLRLTVEKSISNMRVASATGAVSAAQWVQVAFTWDGTVGTAAAAHLFVNGTEATKASSSDGAGTLGYAHATNQPFRIGNASFDPWAGSLNGKMVYLAVYKGRILTSTEMNQLDAQLPIVY